MLRSYSWIGNAGIADKKEHYRVIEEGLLVVQSDRGGAVSGTEL